MRHRSAAVSEADINISNTNCQRNNITESESNCTSQTCEVDGLDGPDEIRLLDLEPLQQLRYEAHDVQLREEEKNNQGKGMTDSNMMVRIRR